MKFWEVKFTFIDYDWEKEEKREEVAFFENCVGALPDILPTLVMDLIGKSETWDELSLKYNVGRSTITKYRKKAIVLLNEMYELRDRQTEAYIFG